MTDLLAKVEAIAASAGTLGEYFIDGDGNVYRTTCPCERHIKGGRNANKAGHEARPLGNIRTNPELAVQLGLTTTGGASS